MAVTNYYAVNAELLGEKTVGSSRIDYLTDALGSVTATLNQSAQVVNTYRYKPYGTQLAKTGTGADPAFTWVGSQGYRQTSRKFADVYVRARHYSASTARWTTTDPLRWFSDDASAYAYANSNPLTYTDPSGLYKVDITRPCNGLNNSILITPDPNDSSSIVAGGPHHRLLSFEEVFPGLSPRPNNMRCIAVNGGFFDPPSGLPIGPVTDCKGKKVPGIVPPSTKKHPVPPYEPVVVQHGSIVGRLPANPGRANNDPHDPRTGACVGKNGKLLAIFVMPNPPGGTFAQFGQCLKANCPKGTLKFVVLDGGGSTKVIVADPPGDSAYVPGFTGDSRSVQNWIVICMPMPPPVVHE